MSGQLIIIIQIYIHIYLYFMIQTPCQSILLYIFIYMHTYVCICICICIFICMYVYVYVCICICMYVFSCQNLCSGYCSFLPLLFEHIRDDNSCIIVYLLSFQSKQCVREHPSRLQANYIHNF